MYTQSCSATYECEVNKGLVCSTNCVCANGLTWSVSSCGNLINLEFVTFDLSIQVNLQP